MEITPQTAASCGQSRAIRFIFTPNRADRPNSAKSERRGQSRSIPSRLTLVNVRSGARFGVEANMQEAFARRGPRRAASVIIAWLALLAATVTAETTVSGVALAQGSPSAPAAQGNQDNRGNPVPPAVQGNPPPAAATEGRAQAPIGHRQPRPGDLPPDVRREEGGMVRSPVDRELDQKMQICRDC